VTQQIILFQARFHSQCYDKTLRDTAFQISTEAMDSCSVAHAFASKVMTGPHNFRLEGAGDLDLSGIKRVLIVAIGKGAASILHAFLREISITEGARSGGSSDRAQPTMREGAPFPMTSRSLRHAPCWICSLPLQTIGCLLTPSVSFYQRRSLRHDGVATGPSDFSG
jgi:hypothetical protein